MCSKRFPVNMSGSAVSQHYRLYGKYREFMHLSGNRGLRFGVTAAKRELIYKVSFLFSKSDLDGKI
jgi:hypothetical protein